jgi:hypothetical protein
MKKPEKRLIERLAATHRLKVTKEAEDLVILGRQGQIYERDDEQLAVMFMPPSTPKEPMGRWCPKIWGNFRRKGEAIGMKTVQCGDSEGCLEFDHRDKAQVKLATKIAGVRAKRTRTPQQIAAFLAVTQNKKFTVQNAS